MKKFLLASSFLFLAFSCTSEGNLEDISVFKEQSLVKSASKTTSTPIIVTLNNDPIIPVCYNSVVDNRNLQLQISQPAPYDIRFQLSLKQKKNNTYLSVPNPWVTIIIPKGETWATIDTACQLESYITCGKYTEIITGNFRLSITSAAYFYHSGETSAPLEYEFNNGINSIDFTYNRACLGGGWLPDDPK